MAEKIRLEDRECPLSATLGLVGEWWTLLILHDAFDGYTRFDEFQVNLGISSSLLTSRLKRLVANGLLERRQYQEHPARYEYVLTDLGRSLRPVIVALAAWGNARLAPTARSMVLVDSETGVEAEPVLVDRASGRRVDGPDFVFAAGPAASKPFRDRYESRSRPSGQARRRESRTARILERVRAIPRGSVRTYSEIDPEAPRVVGRVLATTHEKVPWHRVVRADGSAPLGADQLALLRKERVPLHGDRVDLGRAKRSRPGVVQEGAGRVSGEPHRNRDTAFGK
jgi:DNA-binding HxlR family transcriptional regulator/alkylated DNA nucleotide flippase Atl1